MNTQVVVLYKGLNNPKSRLKEVLSCEERILLSFYMLQDILFTLSSISDIEVGVLTNDPSVSYLVNNLGYSIIPDVFHDINQSLNYYAHDLSTKKVKSLLVLPSDIPCITVKEIETILENKKEGIIIVPSSYDEGTNALLCTPPDIIQFQYGEKSARKHLKEASNKNIDCLQLSSKNIMIDVDYPKDLMWILNHNNSNHTHHFLKNI